MAQVIKTHAVEADGIEYWMAELDDLDRFNYSVGVRDTDCDENLPVVVKFKTREAAEKKFAELVEKS